MPEALLEYLGSGWGATFNLVLSLPLLLLAYNAYTKRWPAITGKYYTKGCITWTEITPNYRAFISYKYHVNNILHNGVIHSRYANQKRLIETYKKGDKVTVFYSPKMPGYSNLDKPPSHLLTVLNSFVIFYLAPLLCLNIPSMFFWWLLTQQH